MERYRRRKLIIIIALMITISGLTIGFAAFTQVLRVSSTATVSPDSSTFSVRFSTKQDSLDESEVAPSSKTDGLETTNGIINNKASSPTISNLSASFTAPGQYAEYTFYARNEGEYKAYLNNVNFVGNKICSGGSDATASLVEAACEAISITVSVANNTYNQTTAIMGHALEKGKGEKVVVRISYASDGARADGEFSVNFGKITMVYSSIDDSTFVPPALPVADNENTINYRMKNLANTDASIDFNATPVAGVYYVDETQYDTNPIYYYRGAVSNNNVLFANLCWKVVRTTETGGVKLIYNGTPTGTQCNGTNPMLAAGYTQFNENYDTAADVRYIYEDGTNSTIKGVIDAWYASNMTAYTGMLEDEGWCMDLSTYNPADLGVTDLPEGSLVYGAGVRALSGDPSVSCPSQYQLKMSASNIGNKLQYPVALLTADELVMAGTGMYGTEGYDVNAYLNIGDYWWALSPVLFRSDGDAGVAVVDSDGYGDYDLVDFNNGVRPAVSLAPGTEISGGDGTTGNPFKVG